MMSVHLSEKTIGHLEWGRVCERLAYHCRGPIAAQAALDLRPTRDASELRARLDRATESRQLIDAGLTVPIGHAEDVHLPLVMASRHGVLDAESLAAIGGVIESAMRCRRYLLDIADRAPALAAVAESLADLPDLGRELRDSFNERGELSNSASGELYELRHRVTGLHSQLKELVQGLVSDQQYEGMLQDEYYTIREDRYVLPIRSGHKNHVDGIVHGWSGSGATVFIEPQSVVEANNRLVFAQADVDREVHRILQRLSRRVGENAEEISRSLDALAVLDLAWASGLLSKELNGVRAEISSKPIIRLTAARHPLLSLGETPVVPNDLQVDDERSVLVLTGPNTGGKTVALKTVGLCTCMALSGLHVPAEAPSHIPLMPAIFSDIGDEQSLDESLSTFSGHLANLQLILDRLEPGTLVLLDELVVGTDPLQGAALAQAILERFADRHALTVVTTHYENLKVLPFEDTRFRNGAMGFDADSGQPSYSLAFDVPGASSALRTARRLGLDPAIVDRAVELAGPEQRALQRVIEDLERERDTLRKLREKSEADAIRLESALAAAEMRDEKLKARLKRGLDTEQSALLRDARSLRDEVKALRKTTRQKITAPTPEWLAETQARAQSIIEGVVEQQGAEAREAAGPELNAASLAIGQTVWVVSLGKEAELVALPDAKGRCQVRAGILTIHVEVSDLRSRGHGKRARQEAAGLPRPPKPEPQVDWDSAPPQTPDNTVDVRGQRVTDALEEIEKFLDRCYGRETRIAFVIHGHGTGALKREVRGWLSKCRYARKHRRGHPHEGGDGVTAILLN